MLAILHPPEALLACHLLVTKAGGRFSIRKIQEGIQAQESWQFIIRWFPHTIGDSRVGAR